MESPKDTDEKHAMYSKGHKIEIIIYDKVNEVIKKHFESILYRYQTGLKILMKGSDFIFERYQILDWSPENCLYLSFSWSYLMKNLEIGSFQ